LSEDTKKYPRLSPLQKGRVSIQHSLQPHIPKIVACVYVENIVSVYNQVFLDPVGSSPLIFASISVVTESIQLLGELDTLHGGASSSDSVCVISRSAKHNELQPFHLTQEFDSESAISTATYSVFFMFETFLAHMYALSRDMLKMDELKRVIESTPGSPDLTTCSLRMCAAKAVIGGKPSDVKECVAYKSFVNLMGSALLNMAESTQRDAMHENKHDIDRVLDINQSKLVAMREAIRDADLDPERDGTNESVRKLQESLSKAGIRLERRGKGYSVDFAKAEGPSVPEVKYVLAKAQAEELQKLEEYYASQLEEQNAKREAAEKALAAAQAKMKEVSDAEAKMNKAGGHSKAQLEDIERRVAQADRGLQLAMVRANKARVRAEEFEKSYAELKSKLTAEVEANASALVEVAESKVLDAEKRASDARLRAEELEKTSAELKSKLQAEAEAKASAVVEAANAKALDAEKQASDARRALDAIRQNEEDKRVAAAREEEAARALERERKEAEEEAKRKAAIEEEAKRREEARKLQEERKAKQEEERRMVALLEANKKDAAASLESMRSVHDTGGVRVLRRSTATVVKAKEVKDIRTQELWVVSDKEDNKHPVNLQMVAAVKQIQKQARVNSKSSSARKVRDMVREALGNDADSDDVRGRCSLYGFADAGAGFVDSDSHPLFTGDDFSLWRLSDGLVDPYIHKMSEDMCEHLDTVADLLKKGKVTMLNRMREIDNDTLTPHSLALLYLLLKLADEKDIQTDVHLGEQLKYSVKIMRGQPEFLRTIQFVRKQIGLVQEAHDAFREVLNKSSLGAKFIGDAHQRVLRRINELQVGVSGSEKYSRLSEKQKQFIDKNVKEIGLQLMGFKSSSIRTGHVSGKLSLLDYVSIMKTKYSTVFKDAIDSGSGVVGMIDYFPPDVLRPGGESDTDILESSLLDFFVQCAVGEFGLYETLSQMKSIVASGKRVHDGDNAFSRMTKYVDDLKKLSAQVDGLEKLVITGPQLSKVPVKTRAKSSVKSKVSILGQPSDDSKSTDKVYIDTDLNGNPEDVIKALVDKYNELTKTSSTQAELLEKYVKMSKFSVPAPGIVQRLRQDASTSNIVFGKQPSQQSQPSQTIKLAIPEIPTKEQFISALMAVQDGKTKFAVYLRMVNAGVPTVAVKQKMKLELKDKVTFVESVTGGQRETETDAQKLTKAACCAMKRILEQYQETVKSVIHAACNGFDELFHTLYRKAGILNNNDLKLTVDAWSHLVLEKLRSATHITPTWITEEDKKAWMTVTDENRPILARALAIKFMAYNLHANVDSVLKSSSIREANTFGKRLMELAKSDKSSVMEVWSTGFGKGGLKDITWSELNGSVPPPPSVRPPTPPPPSVRPPTPPPPDPPIRGGAYASLLNTLRSLY
jgi:hypothetical protein